MDPIRIAGLAISGFGFFKDLSEIYRDLRSWEEVDLEVELGWLGVALEKNVLAGNKSDYSWSLARRVPTLELKGTHQPVLAINKDKRIKYRLVVGPPANRLVLVQKIRASD